MSTEIRTLDQIDRDLHGRYSDLTQYERLSLSVQIERNEILAKGLSVSKNDNHAPALVAIALALGYGDSGSDKSINETLKDLVEVQRMK